VSALLASGRDAAALPDDEAPRWSIGLSSSAAAAQVMCGEREQETKVAVLAAEKAAPPDPAADARLAPLLPEESTAHDPPPSASWFSSFTSFLPDFPSFGFGGTASSDSRNDCAVFDSTADSADDASGGWAPAAAAATEDDTASSSCFSSSWSYSSADSSSDIGSSYDSGWSAYESSSFDSSSSDSSSSSGGGDNDRE
jgi:hypothetical protein